MLLFHVCAIYPCARSTLTETASSTTNSTTNSTSSTSSSLSSSPSLSLSLTSSSLISSSASTVGSSSSLSSLSSSSSSSASGSTTNGVGDYVAQGLGISNPGSTGSSSSSISSAASSPSSSSSGLYSNSTLPSTTSAAANGAFIAAQNATLAASSSSTSSFFNYSSVPAGPEAIAAAASSTPASNYSAAGNYTAVATSAPASSGYWNTSSTNSSIAPTTSYVNGSAAVLSCYSAWADWESSSVAWYDANDGPYITTVTNTLNVTVYSTYKLCDGIPRAVVSGQTETSVYTTDAFVGIGTLTYQVQTITTLIPPQPIIVTTYITTEITVVTAYSGGELNALSTTLFYPVPTPTCEIAPTDCASLYDASSNAMWTGGSFNATASPAPLCNSGNPEFSTYPCTISIPAVQLV